MRMMYWTIVCLCTVYYAQKKFSSACGVHVEQIYLVKDKLFNECIVSLLHVFVKSNTW